MNSLWNPNAPRYNVLCRLVHVSGGDGEKNSNALRRRSPTFFVFLGYKREPSNRLLSNDDKLRFLRLFWLSLHDGEQARGSRLLTAILYDFQTCKISPDL